MITRDENGRAQLGWIEYVVQVLIILSLIAFAIETEPDISPALRNALGTFEIVTIVIFTIEYVARVALSRPPTGYAFSFLGMVDLIAILPFYFSTGLDLRSARAFRLMRMFRILKLARYSAAMRRFHVAFQIVKEELVLFGTIAGILLYLSAVGIYYFEREAQPDKFSSLFDSLWWAVTTLTTVSYGDVYPVTIGGKCFTFLVLLVGLGVLAVPTGLLASALTKARQEEK